ncbi:MAG: BatA and WFA domain-containing protein [Pirellulales bacterium]
MTFAAPLMLWSLAAILPLVAIYLLKVRPRRRPTTALFLWQRILQERRPHHLLHRLRDLWSLLLMALAFAAIALALAQPRWTGAKHQDLLLLIDTSASMQARNGGTTRLALAQERVRDIARAMDGVQRVAVATIDRDLRYLSHLTDNPREILAAVDRAQVSNYELNLRAIPRRGDSSKLDLPDTPDSQNPESGNRQNGVYDHRVLLVSDGSFDRDALPKEVEIVQIGEPQPNVGLIAADLAYVPGQQGQLQFYFQVASSGTEPRELDLLLSTGENDAAELKKVIPLTVQPGLNEPQVLTIEDAPPGRWVAKLDGDDALSADDTVYLVARKPPPIPIAVAADSRFFLEQSVLAFARDSDLLTLVADNPQVTLAHGTPPDESRLIVLGPAGESPWWESLGEEIEVVAPRVLVDDHPALRHIDAGTIQFLGARQIVPPSGSQVLVDSTDGVPLIYVASRAGKSAVVVNLDPIAAEFYYSAWFPVLVHSAATHLVGREEPLRAVDPPGAVVSLPVADDAVSKLTTPSGKSLEIRGKEFNDLAEPGFYQVETGEARGPIACSLLSAQESQLGGAEDTADIVSVTAGVPLAYWFTVLAVLALTTESILYHRRKVG